MVNVGTFILIAIFLWAITNGKSYKNIYINLFCITIIIELVVERGYFLLIGSQQLAYRTICEAVLFVVSIIMLIHKKIKIKLGLMNSFVLVLMALLIGWFSLALFPSEATGATMDVAWDQILVEGYARQRITFTNGMTIEIIQCIMFIGVALCAYAIFDRNDWIIILKRVNRVIGILLYVFVFEVITKYIFKSVIFHTISDAILGASVSTYSRLYTRGAGYMLMGFTKEGSHFTFSIAITFLLMYTEYRVSGKKKITKSNKISFIIIGIIMLLSMSFMSLYVMGCIVLLLLGIRFERKGGSQIKFWLLATATGAILVLLMYILPTIAEKLSIQSFWGRRFFSVLEELSNISKGTWLTASTALEWSNRVRLGSTYETIKLVIYRPLFGLGFAATSAHSSFAMLFSGMGIVGTYLYIKFLCYSARIDKNSYNKQIYDTCVVVYLLMNLLNSLSLRPFYETWVLLLFLSFRFIAEKKPTFNIESNMLKGMNKHNPFSNRGTIVNE